MPFPFKDYDVVVAHCRAIVEQRDGIGRNDHTAFYDQWPHGSKDLSFSVKQRVDRILGAERANKPDTVLADAEDLVNYAIFLVMQVRREREQANRDQAEADFYAALHRHSRTSGGAPAYEERESNP